PLVTFSIQPRRPPRHLLSLPTRRSSDLEQIRCLRGDHEKSPDQDEKEQNDNPGSHEPQLFADNGKYHIILRFREKSQLLYAVAQDRKSTRLNSSHVSISYAVFCLKKKKK